MGLIKKLFGGILKHLVQGNITRFIGSKLVMCWKKFWGEIDRIFAIITRWIFSHCVKTNPNQVFFMPQESKYTCNPKYICEELQRQYPDVKIVWRCPNKGYSGIPARFGMAPLNQFEYFKQIFSSKVIVANSFIFLGQPYTLKKDQVLIQTWHGSLGLKKHSKEVIRDAQSIRRVHALNVTGKRTDYCIVNSDLEYHSLKETYWPDNPKLLYGHPRNDIFFPNFEQKRAELRRRLFRSWGLSPDTKIVMYAPTFRDSTDSFDCYQVDYDRLVDALKKRFGGEWCVLLRYHPSLLKLNPNMQIDCECKLINETTYIDMQELIAVTDVAITDYSSWIYDFVLMRKPGFIFATDIKEYCAHDRGFYYPIQETPFLIAESNDQLVENVLNYNEDVYQTKVEEFLKDKGCIEDGHASERTVALIRDILDGKIGRRQDTDLSKLDRMKI